MFDVHLHDGTKELPNDDIFYVIGKNGIHLRKKIGLIDSMAPVDQISILEPVDTYAKMDIKKMPINVFANVLGFFRAVYDEHRSECVVVLHYNEKNGNYKIEVPPQKVGPGSLEYAGAMNYKGYTRIGTIHSHASMGAFHSGTDDHDEEHFDGIHITLGHMNAEAFGISASIVSNGLRIMIDPVDYIDGVSVEEDKVVTTANTTYANNAKWRMRYLFEDEALAENFPKSWMKRVTRPAAPVRTTYVYGGTYGKHAQTYGKNRHFAPGFHTGGYSRRGGSRVFTPGGAHNEPGLRQPFLYGFRNDEYNLDPCESCAFRDCEGSSHGGGGTPDMDFDDTMRYIFDNFDQDEIIDMGTALINLEEPEPELILDSEEITNLLTMEVGPETSGMDIGMDEIPPSMIMDGSQAPGEGE